MNICHLVNNYYPDIGGIQIQTKSLAEGLADLGHFNFVFTKRSDKRLKKEEVLNGVNIHRGIYPAKNNNFILKIIGALLNTFLLIKMKENYEVIHLKASFIEFQIPCWILRHMFGKNVVYSLSTADELSSFKFSKMRSFQLMIKKMFIHSFEAVVTMSADLTKEVVSFGIPSKKIVYIANGIESDRFVPMPSKKKSGRVIFVGRITPQKGIDVLLRAWKKIVDKGYKYDLCIAGPIKEGEYSEKLNEYITNKHLEKSVTFMGEINYYSDELIDFFQSGDVFVLPSKREGMPGTVLQAMSCGLPIVTTLVSGIEDLIIDGYNGKIVDIDDEEGMADAIIEIVSLDEKEKAKIGKRSRKIITDNFDRTKRIGRYGDLFKKVLSSSPLSISNPQLMI